MGPETFNSSPAVYQRALDKNDDRRVAAWYDALSHSYNELYGLEQLPKHKIVFDFIGHRKFAVLLDVGCGSGTVLQKSRRAYSFALGIDLSVNMIRIAKKKRSAKTGFVVATSRMLPVRDGIADCLVSISTLKADPALPQILKELRRVCRKRGLMVISLFHRHKDELVLDPSPSVRTARISERESVYFIELGTTDTD